MTNRSAYLTVPGPSVTSVLLNIPYVLSLSSDPPPVILMDVHDYERLRAETLQDTGDNKKAPYLLMAFDDLRRRDFLRLIDYADLYPASVQELYLEQNQELLADTPEWVHRQMAMEGTAGWIDYGRGEYQEGFRASLGEDPAAFDQLRQAEHRPLRRLKSGTGDPESINEKILSRGVAALAVRRRADHVLDPDVQGVITGPEYYLLGDFLAATQSRQHAEVPVEQTTAGANVIDTDANHLATLDPVNHVAGMPPKTITHIRDVLDTVGELAMEITGTQHDDWFVLGPTFALPQYNGLFNLDRIRMQMNNGIDANTLAEETISALTTLERRADDDTLSPNKRYYEAEALAERRVDSSPYGNIQGDELAELLEYTLTLSDHSPTLRTLTDEKGISEAAAFVAASIMSDPVRRYDTDTVYRRAMELITRVAPPSVDHQELKMLRKERRTDTWDEHTDWFETVDRAR